MYTSHPHSRRWLPLVSLVQVALCLGVASTALAAPKAMKKAVPATSAPTSLGNGIFVLGDEGTQPLPLPRPSKATAAPAPKATAAPAPKATAAPAPKARIAALLPTPRTNLNVALVRFCRANLGRKVGNGQCSELAVLGLPAIGARLDFNNKWGEPVCNYAATGGRQYIQLAPAGKTRGNPRKVNIKPGDIIQYEGVKFERRWDGGYSFKEYPHHTSVVEKVSRDGNTLKVLEQNVNNTQFVVETLLYLPDLTEGVMHITRPLPH